MGLIPGRLRVLAGAAKLPDPAVKPTSGEAISQLVARQLKASPSPLPWNS